ncbi:MAG: pyridoxamine 5'-phosphate oxidase family protein [Acidobacteria bacterium]|nr:pyridoxamine 5'-phosphate oxidase family protein [Acidobacteriota bacterium]
MAHKFYELLFSDAVKRVQEEYGSRRQYEKIAARGERNSVLTDAETDFIENADGFYLATVGEAGWPYIQYRGGPRGFLKVIDEKTLGFADFRGNLQYISAGNLRGNDRAALFLMDYANRRRLKILAETEVRAATDAPELFEKLRDENYEATVERVFIFRVAAFDWNCPQHITPRYTIDEIKSMVRPMNEYIEKLEREIAELKAGKL